MLFSGKLLSTHFQQLGCGLYTFYPDQVVPNILFTKKIHTAVPDQFFVKYGIVFTFGFRLSNGNTGFFHFQNQFKCISRIADPGTIRIKCNDCDLYTCLLS